MTKGCHVIFSALLPCSSSLKVVAELSACGKVEHGHYIWRVRRGVHRFGPQERLINIAHGNA